MMGMERCRRSSETPDFGDDAEEVSPPPFVHKQFNPACDARRSLRNVYVGDPVLEDVVEVSAACRLPPAPTQLQRTMALF